MVAVIKTGGSVHRILNYNEHKVNQGLAECIGEGFYPMEVADLSFTMKLNRLLKQLELNQNVTSNSVHISLNFDPSEIGMSKEKLLGIADAYMDKIGFGEQPYLVYRHDDAAHPHLHLVSIKVRADGSRIDMHNMGRNQSEKARKEIEKEFGLVVAEGRNEYQKYQLESITMGKIVYGKMQSKKALANILNGVLEHYKYTSLPELNAVLQQYNVLADRCSENSRVFNGGGLLYRILDDQGKPVGVPIKASDFYNKPTLQFLEKQFVKNEGRRIAFKPRIKNTIDKSFLGKPVTLQVLIKSLEKEGIHVALRKNEEGLIYGITYVDHKTKCVFNGSALGKQYSAKAMQERCLPRVVFEPNLLTHSAQKQKELGIQPQHPAAESKADANEPKLVFTLKEGKDLLDVLLQTEQSSDYVSNRFKRRRKKRRKKSLNTNQ